NFAHVTDYVSTPPGSFDVHFAGMGAKGSSDIALAAGTIHTLVVLDTSHSGLQIANLEDAAGSAVAPVGGANTGLGGTAPAPAPSPVLWVGLVAAGALIATAGAYRMRKVRSIARHARGSAGWSPGTGRTPVRKGGPPGRASLGPVVLRGRGPGGDQPRQVRQVQQGRQGRPGRQARRGCQGAQGREGSQKRSGGR